MKLKTDVERVLPSLLTLYSEVASTVVLDHVSRTFRNVVLGILSLAAALTILFGWRKWLKRPRDPRPTDPISSVIYSMGGMITLEALAKWYQIRWYVKISALAILVAVAAWMIIKEKRKKRSLVVLSEMKQ